MGFCYRTYERVQLNPCIIYEVNSLYGAIVRICPIMAKGDANNDYRIDDLNIQTILSQSFQTATGLCGPCPAFLMHCTQALSALFPGQ